MLQVALISLPKEIPVRRILFAITVALLATACWAEDPKSKGESADKLLTAGLAAAKKEGKVVFLAFGSPTCGWCKYLDKFHQRPAVAEILGKQLVFVKVDVVENPGGQKLYETYVAEPSGVPVWVFLGVDGKVLADSFAKEKGKKANIGFPYESNEVAHYESALRTAVPKLSNEEVIGIIKELKAAGPKK